MGRIEKKHLRRQILQYRRLLSETEYLYRNRQLCARILKSQEGLPVKKVHLFLCMERNKEPDLTEVVNTLFSQGIKVVVTRTDFGTRQVHHIEITQNTMISLSEKGIPEPENGLETSLLDVDFIYVPLLLFDKKGHRVGYGGGYYDQILSELPPHTKKVGISLTGGMDQFSFVEAHDAPMDLVITPFETIETK